MLWLISSVGIATYLAKSQITGQKFGRGATFCVARKIIGKYSMTTHRAWRHTEAARHRSLANMVKNLKNQCRTSGTRPASTHHQAMGHISQVARTPPSWPGKARPRGPPATRAQSEARDTTATKTPSMP